MQRSLEPHVPQLPPQPSVPHTRPVQLGTQMPHVPATPAPPQVSGSVHEPHDGLRLTPQRSVTVIVPHVAPRAAQSSPSVSATHPQRFGAIAPHVAGAVHEPHAIVRAAPQRSVTAIVPHSALAAAQNALSVSGTHAQVPAAVQVSVEPQVPHVPPQPSSPQLRPVHMGVQGAQRRPSSNVAQTVPAGHAGTPATSQWMALQNPDELPAGAPQ